VPAQVRGQKTVCGAPRKGLRWRQLRCSDSARRQSGEAFTVRSGHAPKIGGSIPLVSEPKTSTFAGPTNRTCHNFGRRCCRTTRAVSPPSIALNVPCCHARSSRSAPIVPLHFDELTIREHKSHAAERCEDRRRSRRTRRRCCRCWARSAVEAGASRDCGRKVEHPNLVKVRRGERLSKSRFRCSPQACSRWEALRPRLRSRAYTQFLRGSARELNGAAAHSRASQNNCPRFGQAAPSPQVRAPPEIIPAMEHQLVRPRDRPIRIWALEQLHRLSRFDHTVTQNAQIPAGFSVGDHLFGNILHAPAPGKLPAGWRVGITWTCTPAISHTSPMQAVIHRGR